MSTKAKDQLIQFLNLHGAGEAKHSKEDLLTHLIGTSALLESWGATKPVCQAGLFHSVFGTESYMTSLLSLSFRRELSQLIGLESELIVYHFGAMQKETLYENLSRQRGFWITDRFNGNKIILKKQNLQNLFNLTAANWLEQRPRIPKAYRNMRRKEFSAMRPFLLPAARKAVEKGYGFKPFNNQNQKILNA